MPALPRSTTLRMPGPFSVEIQPATSHRLSFTSQLATPRLFSMSSTPTGNDTASNPPAQIYGSLLIPFSAAPTRAEQSYRAANLQKTKGTLFILPPAESVLRATYNAPPRAKTRMSSGAVALCKHFERIPDSPRSKRDQATGQIHPYWTEPRGSNDNKTLVAAKVLDDMLASVCWRNVMLLHRGVAVYEIRNARGWGMRWTLEVEEVSGDDGGDDALHSTSDVVDVVPAEDEASLIHDDHDASSSMEGDVSKSGQQAYVAAAQASNGDDEYDDPNDKYWRIKNVLFRGFLEPIEGMNDELLE